MLIPGLGPVVADDEPGSYRSAPVAVPVLDGTPCRFLLEDYQDDPRPAEFHQAIGAFLALDPSALTAAAPAIFDYYRDVVRHYADHPEWAFHVEIDGPDEVLGHVQFGDEPIVSRDWDGTERVHISVECECAWEPEHGLQIVFRDGRAVTRVGPVDGHLSNATAHGDERLDGVVYHRRH